MCIDPNTDNIDTKIGIGPKLACSFWCTTMNENIALPYKKVHKLRLSVISTSIGDTALYLGGIGYQILNYNTPLSDTTTVFKRLLSSYMFYKGYTIKSC